MAMAKRLGVVVALVLAAAGGGVVASSQSKTVVVCVNKQTGSMRQETRARPCRKRTERSLVLNQTGPAGAPGATGAPGVTGTAGPAGASAVKITELSVCDGTDAGTTADELCKIGMTGPGGGIVFFIDYQDQYPSFCAVGDCNYLEASPTDVDEEGGDFISQWCSDSTTLLNLNTWANSAVGRGRTNTTTADTTCTTGAIQAAVDYVAPAFNGVAKDDWWLPSIGELILMYTNLRQAGIGGFAENGYWSSSEYNGTSAWYQYFFTGDQDTDLKSSPLYVRPVRAF